MFSSDVSENDIRKIWELILRLIIMAFSNQTPHDRIFIFLA